MIAAPSAQAASAPADAAAAAPCSLLRMSVGPEVLAVPIESVREILEVGRLTALPRTPDFVRGVMNLRGAVVPVVDLSARIGHGTAGIGRRSCIVVVEVGAIENVDGSADGAYEGVLVVGLLVDAVFEVFDTDSGAIEAVPMLGTRIRADFLSGMTRARGEVIGIVAVERVLASADLAAAIEAHQAH